MPGGDNGGARIFVIMLLDQLAAIAPQARFILLTQAASHAQLAGLERANMTRLMVVGPMVGNRLRPRILALAGRLLPLMPAPLRKGISRLGYALNTALKRGGSRRRLSDLGVDLLFCPFTAPTYFEPGLATVCTLYDLQFKDHPEFFAAEDIANREQSFSAACRHASVLVAISDYSRASAIVHGGLNPERIRTIPLCMATRLERPVRTDATLLGDLGVEPRGYLLYPANFWPHKNHARLLAAFELACQRGLDDQLKLLLTGAPGPGMERVRDLASQMRLAERVCFPGYVSDTDLAILMEQAAGLVFPSLYEGFGLPVLEAMAAEIPVACSRCTALPEVAGDAARYFDPCQTEDMAQAICDLVGEESTRQVLVRKGRERVRRYADAGRMGHAYWGVFEVALRDFGRGQ